MRKSGTRQNNSFTMQHKLELRSKGGWGMSMELDNQCICFLNKYIDRGTIPYASPYFWFYDVYLAIISHIYTT